MDFRECEYMVEIDKEKNVTKAARNLFISQSALNQQLLKLEKQLGSQLFIRSRSEWHTTEVGEVYLAGARKALTIKKETYKRIYEITHSKNSELRIGLTSGRGVSMFTEIYPTLHARFDDLKITPIEMGVRAQLRSLSEGALDIGFVTLRNDQRSTDNYHKIGEEEMVVVVPVKHPVCYNYSIPKNGLLPMIDLRKLEYEPFVLISPPSTNRQIIDDIFEKTGFDPMILMEINNSASIPGLVASGLCCSIIPRYYVDIQNPNYCCFVLPSHPTWDICVVSRHGSYLTDAGKEFIHLAKNYCDQILTPVQKD